MLMSIPCIALCSLATDTEFVRSRLAEYANDLLSLGVDGFRLDAAKRTLSPNSCA
jgi:glycosidase